MTDSIHSEFAVLGGLLLDNSRISEIDLMPDDFSTLQHQEIFGAIQSLVANEQNADVVTVADLLERITNRKDWLVTVGALANNTPNSHNVVSYARNVKSESLRRKALLIAENLQLALQGEGLDVIDVAIRDLMALETSTRNFECGVKEAATNAVDEIESAWKLKGALAGISSGLRDLDECIGGFRNSDLYVFGARPAMGKTAFLLNLADNAGAAAGIISCEQGRAQLGIRLIAKNGKISAHHMRLGKIQDEQWQKIVGAVGRLVNKKIWINDQPNPTIEQLVRQARKWKFQYGIQVLYVDYIQRIRALPKAPRHEQIGYIVLSLKELARELDIPVIALAQLNRDLEKRDNKRPHMSDFKDSGGIEQEADVVGTLYRDEVYNDDTLDKGIAEINIVKNRHGPIGLIKSCFRGEFMLFTDLETRYA